LYDDTTLAVLTVEFSQGSGIESEYMVRYYSMATGVQLDSAVIPFGYFDDPSPFLIIITAAPDGALIVGGSFRGDTTMTSPVVYRFVNRSVPDTTFYGKGWHSIPLTFGAVLLDVGTFSTSQVVAFVEPSFLALLGDPSTTSVVEPTDRHSITISPNPLQRHFVIEAPTLSEDLHYEIVSMLGAVVQEGTTVSGYVVHLDDAISMGTYCVRVTDRTKKSARFKVVVR
jgi:hypothetical protein